MIAIADQQSLYLLAFANRPTLEDDIEKLQQLTQSTIVPGITPPLISIERELEEYFKGTLHTFTTPIAFIGSEFQQQTWQALTTIPYGTTQNYATLAAVIEKPLAHRAVANANRCNRLAIIVPCHRIIKSDGALCGYNGGVDRKQWLINHESSCAKAPADRDCNSHD